MSPLALTVEDPTELVDAIFNEPIMCESGYCRDELGRGPHEADWYAIGGPCGDICAVCSPRRARVRQADGWLCVPNGCRNWHFYDQIEWKRIDKG